MALSFLESATRQFRDVLNYYQGSPSHNRPGIPIELDGLLDSARRLLARRGQMEPALAGLSRTYEIGGFSAPARDFLFGPTGVASPDRVESGLEQAIAVLRNVEGEAEEALFALMRVFSGGVFRLEAENSEMTRLPLDSLDQYDISLTEFDRTFEEAQPFLPGWKQTLVDEQAATDAFWPNFAENGLAYNLLFLEKLRGAKLAALREAFGASWLPAWDGVAASGLLYAIDLRIFSRFPSKHVDQLLRFTPGTVTLLEQDAATKQLRPVAVRVANFQEKMVRVFVRGQNNAHWLYALQAAKTSVTVYGIWLGHVYHWHIVTAAALKAMLENVDDVHPVGQILKPQSEFLMQFDEILLLIWDFIAPPTSFDSKESFLQLIDAFAEGRNFFDDDPRKTLERHGIVEADFSVVQPWDRYPIVAHYLECYAEVETYVGKVVDSFGLSDAAVANDEQIKSWLNEAERPHAGNLRGIGAVSSVASLKALLTSLVYRTSMHGCSRLRKSLSPVLSYMPNYPVCLQSEVIPGPDDEVDLLKYLPYTGTIGLMTRFYDIFIYTAPYVPLVPTSGVDQQLFYTSAAANQALVDFRQSILALMGRIQPLRSQPHQWPRGIET